MHPTVASRAGAVTIAALLSEEDLRSAARRSEARRADTERRALVRAQPVTTVPEVRRRLGLRLSLRFHRAAVR